MKIICQTLKKQINNYIVRQNNWIKANDLKPGDKVLVRKTHESYTKGWNYRWNEIMSRNVGQVLKIVDSRFKFVAGIKLQDENNFAFLYPYTILQKIYEDGNHHINN